jgi:hypothetical protein
MTQNISNLRILQQTSERVPALKHLYVLTGEWNMKITDLSDPAAVVFGDASFKWLPGEYFLVQTWDFASLDFPSGIALIGWSTITENFSMHTYDSRGIARIYEMGLKDGVWKIWRVAPGFSQRFKGTFADDGNTILGSWEKSVDDSSWEYDFSVTYTRLNQETSAEAFPAEQQVTLSLSQEFI